MSSALYIVATPIGNLEDITYRAVRTLQQVDLIAAEDTRHTLQLLRALEIQKPLLSLHEHNEQSRVEQIAGILAEEKSVALVSDAGTPCISDPGARLVQAIRKKGHAIVPIPGPSAVITALSATGLTQGGFCFYGFLPVKGTERKQVLSQIQKRTQTVVLYESPHKLLKTLEDLSLYCNNPVLSIGRELTKVYEEFLEDTAEHLVSQYQAHPPKGEFVLMIPAAEKQETQAPDKQRILALMQQYKAQGLRHKQAAEQAALQTGISKKTAYEIGMEIFHR